MAKPDRTVVYLSEKAKREDVECLDLGRAGYYLKAIAKQTGLTVHQVSYRLKMAGIKPSEYRRMETELSQRIANMIHEDSKKYFDTMVSAIRRYLKE